MKLYRRAAFMDLPPDTLFAKGKPWYFESLSVKGDTWRFDTGMGDFLARGLVWIDAPSDGDADSRLAAMLEADASFPIETAYGRDGCFDEADLFLVYERADLEELRRVIDAALAVCPAPIEDTREKP